MAMQHIPKNRWVQFLDHFSKLHDHWTVDVELRRSDGSSELMAGRLQLQGITADEKGGANDIISIVIGRTPEESLTHIVSEPIHLTVERAESAADRFLRIETADGGSVIITLIAPASAEMIDEMLVH